jgi:regulator of ribosome biosynthesis
VPVSYDFGNLAVFDSNPLEADQLAGEDKEQHLKDTARDNVQLLVNQILQLPVKRTADSHNSSGTQDSTVALFQLPEPTTALPREKPIPKPKPPTKWELFAAKKGIQKKAKDGKLVFDEATGKWVPKWGYKGKNKELDSQWLVEVDDKDIKKTGDELVDPRKLARAERVKLVKKNQRQQEKNAKRALGK